jgi:hypothetical protein
VLSEIPTIQTSGDYIGYIPAQPLGSAVEYYVEAQDYAGHTGSEPGDAPGSLLSFSINTDCDFTYYLPAGWSMVSLPCDVPDPSLGSLFPDAVSLFKFSSSYLLADTLKAGVGYWINLSDPSSAQVAGTSWPRQDLVLSLPGGWSLIGPGGLALSKSGLKDAFATLISVFTFSNGYVDPASVDPGGGYWVHLSDAVDLDLSGSVAPLSGAAKVGTPGVDQEEGQRVVSLWAESGRARQLLALGVDPEQVVLLPPVPPGGQFDVRIVLASGEAAWQAPAGATPAEYAITAQGDVERVSWRAPASDLASWQLDVDGRAINLVDTGSIALEPGAVLTARRTAGIPLAFALHANYPNPFNPGTTIHYDLPSSALVRLVIYDALGQVVRELVAQEQPAGRHTMHWDGRDQGGAEAANGVYFCELTAGASRAVGKMLMIR